MTVRRRLRIPTGRGVVVRHARSCRRDPCTCDPSFEAWVWDAAKSCKVRRTLRTAGDAQLWRLSHLRRMYASAPGKGRLDEAYSRLRRTMLELDGARAGLQRRRAAEVGEVLDVLYRAEDLLLEVLRRV